MLVFYDGKKCEVLPKTFPTPHKSICNPDPPAGGEGSPGI